MSSVQTVELTAVKRVLETPMLATSWSLVHEILSKSEFTKLPLDTAVGAANTANNLATVLSQPLITKLHLAPLIQEVDSLTNNALDFVEEKYPLVFELTAQDVIDKMETDKGNATKATMDYMYLLDAQFAPIVDVVNNYISSEPVNADHQYERIIALVKIIIYKLLNNSEEQVRHVVTSINSVIESISAAAKDPHTLPETWLAEFLGQLQKLNELSMSLAAQAKEKVELIPGTKPVLELFEGIADDLTPVVTELSNLVADPSVPLSDKMDLFRAEMTDTVLPAFESIKARLFGLVFKSE